MPKHPTCPTLYDEALQIDAWELMRWGYVERGTYAKSRLRWSRGDQVTARVGFEVRMDGTEPHVILDYTFNGEPRKYRVGLVCVPSNLGKGEIWYFLCPITGKRCRKLYSVGGWFGHREAFGGCMYESQTTGRRWREIEKTYGPIFKLGRLYKELFRKHRKTSYRGKPTRGQKRLLAAIRKAKQAKKLALL